MRNLNSKSHRCLTFIFSFFFVVVFYKPGLAQENKPINQENTLNEVHNRAVERFKEGLDLFYNITSKLKNYTQSLDSPPTKVQLSNFIDSLRMQVNYMDSMYSSFLDTNHQFVFIVDNKSTDPAGIEGFNISWLRNEDEIAVLDSIMKIDTIRLTEPINLIEGWPALPFSFSIKLIDNQIYGYLATVFSTNYLVNQASKYSLEKQIVHRFTVNDSIDFTSVAVYNNSTIFNQKTDSLYYKNLNLEAKDFIYSSFVFHGMQFQIGSVYLDK